MRVVIFASLVVCFYFSICVADQALPQVTNSGFEAKNNSGFEADAYKENDASLAIVSCVKEFKKFSPSEVTCGENGLLQIKTQSFYPIDMFRVIGYPSERVLKYVAGQGYTILC